MITPPIRLQPLDDGCEVFRERQVEDFTIEGTEVASNHVSKF